MILCVLVFAAPARHYLLVMLCVPEIVLMATIYRVANWNRARFRIGATCCLHKRQGAHLVQM